MEEDVLKRLWLVVCLSRAESCHSSSERDGQSVVQVTFCVSLGDHLVMA